MEGERKQIPVGTRVVVRKNGTEGRVVRLATNGKWPEMWEHKVVYGRFNRTGWFEAFDLLVIEGGGEDLKR